MNDVIFFLTTSDSKASIERFNSIDPGCDKIVAYERHFRLNYGEGVKHWAFDVMQLPYKTLGPRAVPGSTLYAAIFYAISCEYDNIWFVEDDVIYTGDWVDLVSKSWDFDFICPCIEKPDPEWAWFKSFQPPGKVNVEDFNLLKSLCCVCRITRRVAIAIHGFLSSGAAGHHEIVVPTIVDYVGFKQTDFVKLGYINRDLFHWRPVIGANAVADAPLNLFIHPVKV